MNYAAVLLSFIIMGAACAYMAKQKNRSPISWFFLGALFGIFSLLAIIIISKKPSATPEPENVKIPDIQKIHSEATAFTDGGPYSPAPITLRISRDSTLDWYFIDAQSAIIGPLKLTDLRKALIERKLDNQTYIWCEEFIDWVQIKSLQNGGMVLDPDFL